MDPVADEQPVWLDLTKPADRERWRATKSKYGDKPLPASAYRDRVRPVNSQDNQA